MSRSVARYTENCSHCGEPILKGSCLARMFNYNAHGRSVCEDSIVERYDTAVHNAHNKVRA